MAGRELQRLIEPALSKTRLSHLSNFCRFIGQAAYAAHVLAFCCSFVAIGSPQTSLSMSAKS